MIVFGCRETIIFHCLPTGTKMNSDEQNLFIRNRTVYIDTNLAATGVVDELNSHHQNGFSAREWKKDPRCLLWTAGPDSPFWKSKCGNTRKDSGRGYENFISHVWSAHLIEFRDAIAENSQPASLKRAPNSSVILYEQDTVDVLGWLSFVVHGLQPFNVVENPTFRSDSNFQPMTIKTFHKYLDGVTKK